METLNIGTKIKKLRELKNLTQEHMASVIGVTQSAYSRMEMGETEITYSKLERIAGELGMKPEEVIAFNESMVFNVMHNQTGNGLIIQNNALNNEERELYKQQIETLKEEVTYLKKIIDNKRLVAEKTTTNYQQQFRDLFMALNDNPNYTDWMDIYKKLVYWELEMEKSDSPEMQEILASQKAEANTEFFKFVSRNYAKWVNPKSPDAPIMSHNLLQYKVLPHVETGIPTFFILIDNLRYDQWKTIQPIFSESFRILEEETFYSILPTATQYSRNAIFSGLMPIEIEKQFPIQWKNDEEEGGKNLFEEHFFRAQLKRLKKDDLKISYTKVLHHHDGQHLVNNIHNMLGNDLNIIVYNFVDMLSHARTEMEVLKELAGDEKSYRSVTKSWFEHSALHQALKKIADKKINLIVATDHGTVRVKSPYKVIGDKQTTTNLRYKHGRNLNYEAKEVLAFKDPREAGLPVPNVNSAFIFAKEDGFLCYPNNYNHYVNYYRNTFQHGGVSLEEMIIPVIRMVSKNS